MVVINVHNVIHPVLRVIQVWIVKVVLIITIIIKIDVKLVQIGCHTVMIVLLIIIVWIVNWDIIWVLKIPVVDAKFLAIHVMIKIIALLVLMGTFL